ncbi:MAG TPA: hypothetical protein VHF27_04655 [Acidimicrobiales bacterium]|nr:hypothetical protein [Acidimicrobiales bacterium]
MPALLGVALPLAAWLTFVPWDLSSTDSAPARMGVVLLVGAAGSGACAYASRAAGRSFVLAAVVTTLLLFLRAGATSDDPLWPMLVPVFLLVALGAFVLAFALGRFLRSGSATG